MSNAATTDRNHQPTMVRIKPVSSLLEVLPMKVTTVDPISGNEVTDAATAPFVIEGSGADSLKIYFESEENKASYLEIEAKTPETVLRDVYNRTTSDAREM